MSALRRLGLAVPLAVATAGLLFACAPGTGTPAAAPPANQPTATTTTGAPAATGATANPAPPATTVPAPPQQPPAGGANCTLDHLSVTAASGGAGSGHRSMVLVFTNTGSAVCKLYGYPGVAGLDSGGNQIQQAARALRGYLGGLAAGKSPEDLFLGPGESASAIVEALAFHASDGSACTPFANLLVTPPNETHSVRVAWDNDGCDSLQIHPVVLGKTGQGS